MNIYTTSLVSAHSEKACVIHTFIMHSHMFINSTRNDHFPVGFHHRCHGCFFFKFSPPTPLTRAKVLHQKSRKLVHIGSDVGPCWLVPGPRLCFTSPCGSGTWDEIRLVGVSSHKSSSVLHPLRQEERGLEATNLTQRNKTQTHTHTLTHTKTQKGFVVTCRFVSEHRSFLLCLLPQRHTR